MLCLKPEERRMVLVHIFRVENPDRIIVEHSVTRSRKHRRRNTSDS